VAAVAGDAGIPDDLLPPLPAPPEAPPAVTAAPVPAPSDEVTPPELPPLRATEPRRRPPRSPLGRGADGGRGEEHDADLGRERALIETARTALLRRDPQAARIALERHQVVFRRGRLREERQALMVQALALGGQPARARALAAEFRRRYPRSLLLPLVEGSVRGLPE
jgi:hypothetical protein